MNCASVLHEGKSEVLNNFFASLFTATPSSHKSQLNGQQDGDWENKVLPTLSEEKFHDLLRNLNIYKSLGPSEMPSRVLRELSDGVPKPLSTILKKFIAAR